jgi:hypothetical protein
MPAEGGLHSQDNIGFNRMLKASYTRGQMPIAQLTVLELARRVYRVLPSNLQISAQANSPLAIKTAQRQAVEDVVALIAQQILVSNEWVFMSPYTTPNMYILITT